MTPYDTSVHPSVLVQAASIELRQGDTAESVDGLLRAMQTYHINTVSVYGLEDWEPAGATRNKDSLFTSLNRLDMQLVVRIETYDPTTFAFRASDADQVLTRYQPLLQYLANANRRARIAYFAVNMPLDDSRVTQPLGGVNSALTQSRQPEYARAIVTRLRATLRQQGFGEARIRLGVFYGWDGGYSVPSYAGAAPDGYYLTNYSYPSGSVPDENSPDQVLINQPRLQAIMNRFTGQYGNASFVVEYGFHTMEFNGWIRPDQNAGLVTTLSAKQRAIRATTRFYRDNYSGLAGTSYFGFNLIKREGNTAELIDWALQYP